MFARTDKAFNRKQQQKKNPIITFLFLIINVPTFLYTVLSKSCSDLKRLDPKAKSGVSLIDPDGEGVLKPYHVTCDMSDKEGVGVTVIGHYSENRTLVDGCEPPGCYSRDIHYTRVTFPQLASLSRVSSFCEQFIKYECRGSIFHSDNNRTYAWWVSRDSMDMNYWGGAAPDSDKCACGINGTCAKRGGRCNCDKNNAMTWREDSGLLTEKTHLPVKQLRFGDTEANSEQGYHTLGKFKCYGIA